MLEQALVLTRQPQNFDHRFCQLGTWGQGLQFATALVQVSPHMHAHNTVCSFELLVSLVGQITLPNVL